MALILTPTFMDGKNNVSDSADTLYTVPASTQALVRGIIFSNSTAADLTVILVAATIVLLTGKVVPANDSITMEFPGHGLPLAAAETITATASAATGINSVIYGATRAV